MGTEGPFDLDTAVVATPPPASVSASVLRVTVLGTDTYIAGYLSTDTMSYPCYWKNAVRVDLDEDGTFSGFVNAVRAY